MFQDNNFWFLLFAVIPAIIYSLIIFLKSPKGSVKMRMMWVYISIGVLSIQILKTIHFLFPNIHQYIENHYVIYDLGNGIFKTVEEPTLWAIFVFAFFQIAFFEELSKWFALRVGNAARGDTRSGLDSPFAVMFYSVMIGVGFAIFENIHYVGRALWGDLKGINLNDMLIVRSLNSVIVHMISGLFMGYFIAIGRRCKNVFKHAGYTLLGLISATIFHGLYDFNLMKPGVVSDYVNIFGLDFHIKNNLMIVGALFLSYLLASHLSKIKYHNGLMR